MVADILAGYAAKKISVPPSISAPLIHHHNLVKCIQKRLFVIICDKKRRGRVHHMSVPRTIEAPLESVALASSHAVVFCKGRATCSQCMHSLSCKTLSVARDWLRTTCKPAITLSDRPEPLHYCSIQLGHLVAHSSHRMYNYRGFIYCGVCGSLAVKVFHKLSKPCEHPSAAGEKNLKAFRAGRNPPNYPIWPIVRSSLVRR